MLLPVIPITFSEAEVFVIGRYGVYLASLRRGIHRSEVLAMKVDQGRSLLLQLVDEIKRVMGSSNMPLTVSVRVRPRLLLTTPRGYTFPSVLSSDDLVLVNLDDDAPYADSRIDESVLIQAALYRISHSAQFSVSLPSAPFTRTTGTSEGGLEGRVLSIPLSEQKCQRPSQISVLDKASKGAVAVSDAEDLTDATFVLIFGDGECCFLSHDMEGMIQSLRNLW